MQIAFIAYRAPALFSQRERWRVPANVAQQVHPFGGKHGGERVPASERDMALAKGVAAFGAM